MTSVSLNFGKFLSLATRTVMFNNIRQIIVCLVRRWASPVRNYSGGWYIFHKHARRVRQVGEDPTTDCEGARADA